MADFGALPANSACWHNRDSIVREIVQETELDTELCLHVKCEYLEGQHSFRKLDPDLVFETPTTVKRASISEVDHQWWVGRRLSELCLYDLCQHMMTEGQVGCAMGSLGGCNCRGVSRIQEKNKCLRFVPGLVWIPLTYAYQWIPHAGSIEKGYVVHVLPVFACYNRFYNM